MARDKKPLKAQQGKIVLALTKLQMEALEEGDATTSQRAADAIVALLIGTTPPKS